MKVIQPLLALVFLFSSAVLGALNLNAKTNVVVYYGQGPNQKDLIEYCADPAIDAIILSFVHLFPAQANGYPGTNFGNQCWGTTYAGPGDGSTADALQKDCPRLAAQIPTCQKTYGKRVLLSLGGGTDSYQLTGAAEGQDLAEQLWGMFGPRTAAWVAAGKPRPFDGPAVAVDDGSGGTSTSPGNETQVDGFDLDIEHASTDGQAGYVALATRLRQLYPPVTAAAPKRWLLTASPQCVVPDANLDGVLAAVPFDLVMVQFYNTPACSAARWAAANQRYSPGGAARPAPAGFTLDAWLDWLRRRSPSPLARVLISLPGDTAAASAGQYISRVDATRLVGAYYCRPQLGGIAIWDATYAARNVFAGNGYAASMKKALVNAAGNKKLQTCPK